MGFVGIINTFILVGIGAISGMTFLNTIAGFWIAFLGYILAGAAEQNWYWRVLYIALFVLEIGAIAANGGSYWIIKAIP